MNSGTQNAFNAPRPDSEVIALIVRYRCAPLRGAAAERRCQVEIEDVEAGDTRRFLALDEGIAHLRERILAFSRRPVLPGPSHQTD